MLNITIFFPYLRSRPSILPSLSAPCKLRVPHYSQLLLIDRFLSPSHTT